MALTATKLFRGREMTLRAKSRHYALSFDYFVGTQQK